MDDLHCDAAIMQLVRVVNAATCHTAPPPAPRMPEMVVTPLGGTTGLVQWLQDTVPLYHLYSHAQGAEQQPSVVERFYAMLLPALKVRVCMDGFVFAHEHKYMNGVCAQVMFL